MILLSKSTKEPTKMKNKWLAAALNLIPGIGYIYLGETRIVFGVMLLLFWVAYIAAFMLDPMPGGSVPFTPWDALVILMFEAAFVTDAFIEAKRFNATQGKSGEQKGISMSANNTETTKPQASFFVVSPAKLAIMSVATLGLYQIYWFYRNW